MKQEIEIFLKEMGRRYTIVQEGINDNLNEVKKARKNSEYFSNQILDLADDFYRLGCYAYMLNKKNEAENHFKTSTKYFQMSYADVKWGSHESIIQVFHWEWIESMTFSRDPKLRKECSKILLKDMELHNVTINPLHYETLTLCYYFVGDNKRFTKCKKILKKQEELIMSMKYPGEEKYRGRVSMIEGIINNKYDQFLQGCKASLKQWRYRSTIILLCTSVLKYLFLADEYDLRIQEKDIPKGQLKYLFSYFIQ